MSMSIIDLHRTESWSISTALCVLSGNNETDSSSAIGWNCCWWAPGHADCPVASSRPSDQRQRRPDDRKCWAGNVVRSGDVEWLTVNDVGWECLRLVYSIRPGTLGPCSADSDALWLPLCSCCCSPCTVDMFVCLQSSSGHQSPDRHAPYCAELSAWTDSRQPDWLVVWPRVVPTGLWSWTASCSACGVVTVAAEWSSVMCVYARDCRTGYFVENWVFGFEKSKTSFCFCFGIHVVTFSMHMCAFIWKCTISRKFRCTWKCTISRKLRLMVHFHVQLNFRLMVHFHMNAHILCNIETLC